MGKNILYNEVIIQNIKEDYLENDRIKMICFLSILSININPYNHLITIEEYKTIIIYYYCNNSNSSLFAIMSDSNLIRRSSCVFF
jgi:hypothetical protein